MFNYRINRIGLFSVFKHVTIISLIFGGFWGLFLGLVARDMIGMLSGLFLGFIFGLTNGIIASIYTFLFNSLSSSIGGIEIQLTRKDAFLDSLDQPIPLVDEVESSPAVTQTQQHESVDSKE